MRGVLARNVLIFHSGALGDFVLTWPMTLALARLFPQSRIFCITHGQKGALAERVLRVESADIESGWHALFGQSPELPERADSLLRGAHTIVNFSAESAGPWEGNVRSINSAARLSLLSAKPPDDFVGHMVDFLIDQWKGWPAAHATVEQLLRGINERGLTAGVLDPQAILIHPGSGSPTKNWPAERFLELAGQFKKLGQPIRFVLGEVELERWPAETIRNLPRPEKSFGLRPMPIFWPSARVPGCSSAMTAARPTWPESSEFPRSRYSARCRRRDGSRSGRRCRPSRGRWKGSASRR